MAPSRSRVSLSTHVGGNFLGTFWIVQSSGQGRWPTQGGHARPSDPPQPFLWNQAPQLQKVPQGKERGDMTVKGLLFTGPEQGRIRHCS